jgi:hypothetical protein
MQNSIFTGNDLEKRRANEWFLAKGGCFVNGIGV